MSKTTLFILALLLLAGCVGSQAAPIAANPTAISPTSATVPWPTHGWQTSTPEAQGIDSAGLLEMFDYIKQGDYPIHSILIVRNGNLVMEAYFHPFQADIRHAIASCTKSFTSALIGIAMKESKIANVNQKVLDFFSDLKPAALDDRKRGMTLESLLTMSSGLDWPTSGLAEDLLPGLYRSSDWSQYILDRPMAAEPGRAFNYSSANSYLLSAIIKRTTAMSALDYGRKNLFGPLGITDIVWPSDPSGVNTGGGGLELTPVDMAKFGYLFLKNGEWEGQTILPAEWVKASSASHITPNYLGYNYGYQWWVDPAGGYHARGYGGERIFVVPDRQMVVVITSGFNDLNMEAVPDNLLKTFIIPAVKSDHALPANPGQTALLAERLNAIANPPPKPVPTLPAIAAQISGKTYLLQSNSLGLKIYNLNFSGDKATGKVQFEGNPTVMEMEIGLDGNYRTTRVQVPGIPVDYYAQKGGWISDDTFIMYAMKNGATVDLHATFKEKRLELEIFTNGTEFVTGTLQE